MGLQGGDWLHRMIARTGEVWTSWECLDVACQCWPLLSCDCGIVHALGDESQVLDC